MKKDKLDRLGRAIDSVDALAHALQLPLRSDSALRSALPAAVKELKAGYVEAAGENPWEGEPS